MNLNHYLHNVVSFFVLLGVYMGLSAAVQYAQVYFAADGTFLSRWMFIALVVILLIGVPTLVYSYLKWLLLSELKVKQQKFWDFFVLTSKLVLIGIVGVTLLQYVGNVLREPTNSFFAAVILIYALLCYVLYCFYILYVQLAHKHGLDAVEHWKKKRKLGWYLAGLSLGMVLVIWFLPVVFAYLNVRVGTAMEYLVSLLVVLLGIYGYTHWQRMVYNVKT